MQTKRRFFLNVVVSRKQQFKYGAKTEARPHGLESKAKDVGSGTIPPNTQSKGPGLREQSDSKAEGHFQSEKTRASSQSDSCNTSTGTRKKRSPSTIKRNRERWDRWQARSREVGAFILSRTKPGHQNLRSGVPVPDKNSSKPAPRQDLEPKFTSPKSVVKENKTSRPDDLETEGPNNLPDKPSVADKDVASLPILIAHCDKCKKPRSACPDGLKKCTRCFKSHYCSRVCQSADWHWHKLFCKPPA